MTINLTSIKDYLGKYYSELNYSAIQEKYKNTNLDTFFEQRFYIQNNKVQMIVDPAIRGLIVNIAGNEIHISKELFDHPNITITNSLENNNQNSNPRSLYNAETFSTLAYLVCQNHTMFQITGAVDEPIYVKYKTDYETFYNSVVVFDISDGIKVEIIEEIESFSALNAVTNYILHPNSAIKLSTFYQNNISGISFVFRNIIAQDNSKFNHILFGRGSSNAIDENKIRIYSKSTSEFLGVVNSNDRNFHSILYVQPAADDYSLSVDYRDILYGKAKVSFFPVILGNGPSERTNISVSNITLEEIPAENIGVEIKKYISDITDKATSDRIPGIKRFYDNKIKFLNFP
jgi:hypothetical protein